MEVLSQSQRILNAAFECIALKGYANVSLRDIADKAGVALSQLNYYYKNKEGLFTEVIKALSQKYTNEIEDELAKGGLAKEKLLYVINYFQKILAEQPEVFKVLYDVTGMALWSSVFRKPLQELYENLSNLIEKHIIKDHFYKIQSKYSCKALSRMILGTLIGTGIQAVLNPKENYTDSLKGIERILIDRE